MQAVQIASGEDRVKPILGNQTLAAAVFGSLDDGREHPFFVGGLKTLSMRSKREARYVDSFRYDFLIVEALYGKGKFKSKQLAGALKSDVGFMRYLDSARETMRWTIESITDDTEEIICSKEPVGSLVDHIVKKRGYYFHGQTEMTTEVNRRGRERTLCLLLNHTTDRICQQLIGDAYSEEAWEGYLASGRKEGMVTELGLRALLRHRETEQLHCLTHAEERIGDSMGVRTRIAWLLESIDGLTYEEEDWNLVELTGRDQRSSRGLFRVGISKIEAQHSATGRFDKDGVFRPNTVFGVKYELDDDEDYTLRMGPKVDEQVSGTLEKSLLVAALREARTLPYEGLHRISCNDERTGESVFEVTFMS